MFSAEDGKLLPNLPMFFLLHGRNGLAVGNGPIADRKVEFLERAGALVRRTPVFDEVFLQGCAVAIGADAPDAELEALSKAAQARGIPVNIVDRPALCSFIMPAIVDRDPVTIAIGTGGAAPVLARLIRAKIEAMLPPNIGRVAAIADEFKEEMRARLPDLSQRRRLIERMFAGKVAALALAGEEDAARQAVAAEIAAEEAGGKPAGVVHLVGAGPGEADLLTIRAQRVLGEADVIVHGADVSAAVLDMARRDAERVASEGDAARASVVALVRAGNVVVWITPGAGQAGAAEEEALRAAGVACAVVPGLPG